MVKPAERQSVVDLIRAAGRVPPDVGGLQAEQLIAEANVVVAHGASALVRTQYGGAEGRVACRSRCVSHRPLRTQSDRIANLIVERLREVTLQQKLRRLRYEFSVAEQPPIVRF